MRKGVALAAQAAVISEEYNRKMHNRKSHISAQSWAPVNLYLDKFYGKETTIGIDKLTEACGAHLLEGDDWYVANYFILRYEITRMDNIIARRDARIEQLERKLPSFPLLIKKFPEYFNYQEVAV